MVIENQDRIDVSIIIVNYRGWFHLEKCLQSIADYKNCHFSYEVIIVDNCSNDGKLDQFRTLFPDFSFVLNTGNNGFANGCNFGFNIAKGEFLLFLNPDVLSNGEAIQSLLNTIRTHPKISILSCRHINLKGKDESTLRLFPSFFTINGLLRALYRTFSRSANHKNLLPSDGLIFPEWVSGSLILISSVDFHKIGRWSEDYWLYYEDVDLCWQAISKTGKIALSNEVFVTHHHGGATRINPTTAILTKSEVKISLHVFISRNYNVFKAIILHSMVIIDNLIIGFIPFLLGLIFFYIKKVNLNTHIYFRMVMYYLNAIRRLTWLSPRSVNYKR